MVEPSGHCPYLGLKQNQAIRFASPTPEHRCYATGQAQDIPTLQPDYQASYCLSSGHVRCPLYTGSGLPSTPPITVGQGPVVPAGPLVPISGLRGWFSALTPRDRGIYIGLLALLLVIFSIYSVAGVNLLRDNGLLGDGVLRPDLPIVATSTASLSEATSRTPTNTLVPTSTSTPSVTRTSTPSPTRTSTPSEIPTEEIFIPPPPTFTSTASPLTPEITDSPTEAPTSKPTAEPTVAPTAEPTAEPTAAPTAEPTVAPTAEPTAEPTVAPTAEPTAEPTVAPTAEPTVAPTAEPTVAPTAPPTFESPTDSLPQDGSRTSEPPPPLTPLIR